MTTKLNFVLIVDDNETDNFLHTKVIEKAGITDLIGIALNGQEALDFLINLKNRGTRDRSFLYHALIFLDINMPLMDGWEFLEEYTKLDKDQKVGAVIIMLSSSQNNSDLEKAEEALGSGCFLYKPLTSEKLNEIMQKHFPEYL